jgi:hypothetical protein
MRAKKIVSSTKVVVFLCCFCLIAISFWACSEGNSLIPSVSDDEQADLKSAKIYKTGDVFNLSGVATYHTWKVGGGEEIQNVPYECNGSIEFLDSKNFKYSFAETRANGNSATFYGKITASGELSFQFPTPLMETPDGPLYITDIIKNHSGATAMWGPGVNQGTLFFKGKFDGTKFTALAYFMAKIEEHSDNNDMFETPVDGVLHWTFGYELEVVD